MRDYESAPLLHSWLDLDSLVGTGQHTDRHFARARILLLQERIDAILQVSSELR